MRATFSHNGKKYIYKVDGKQVRTSQKSYPYECVAVRLYDGEFLGAIACGQYKTCAQYLNMDADIVSRYKITLSLVRGEISYSTYLNQIGFSHAMTKEYFREIMEGVRKMNILRDMRKLSTIILTIQQLF